MEVILLERVGRLGNMGDTVKVRDGFARNFLLPQGKALRANKANMVRFEAEKAALIARNDERRAEAEKLKVSIDQRSFVVVRQAGETGQLYGSVSARDVMELLSEAGFSITRNQVDLLNPIKTIGLHNVLIQLHPEVDAGITLNVARSEDEASRQARGEDLTQRDEGFVREVGSILDEEDEDEGEYVEAAASDEGEEA
ncbi:50S ribosomal protein L9 [Hartmannibacter diazotrophicus]|uniref:Large ribosomal subunit protein bL9 n=1 Tax=Hartmannibacter diazotrophicus TaxID=1482074 RepID=A0A2C9D552_9HYPH|nr:50S ribosomal protein L9 [Hartmannibacter diazotrophicus]SON55353.1 50S ribosomal protein L9 [Hartmannibacter diazotrophicus]